MSKLSEIEDAFYDCCVFSQFLDNEYDFGDSEMQDALLLDIDVLKTSLSILEKEILKKKIGP